MGTRHSFTGIKQPRQEVYLSPLSSAKAKNVHALPPLILYAFMVILCFLYVEQRHTFKCSQ
jgi:hypothetical protein